MENIAQRLDELDRNLGELNTTEHDISMMEVEIYQRLIEQAKYNRLNTLKLYFEEQAKTYNQNLKKYQKNADNIIKNYEKQMDKLIKRYDAIYLTSCDNLQFARNNQKIAVGNIVTLKGQSLDTEDMEEKEELRRKMLSCAQKKLNYGVIIEECQARIEWCIENSKHDLDMLFSNNWNQVQIYNNNIWNKLRNAFLNRFFGRNKYRKLLLNYEITVLNNIKTRINQRSAQLEFTLLCIAEQMKEVKKQIRVAYENMMTSQTV